MRVLVSVIIPVYRTPLKWLELAINSILDQDFKNFECLLVNDNPSDGALNKFLEDYKQKDERIVIVRNEENLGVPASLNKAIRLANGKYIARMDADDIAIKERLSIQYKFLENNPEVSLCGSQVMKIDPQGKIIAKSKNPIGAALVRKFAKYQNPTTHPTWMFRKSDFLTIGEYKLLPNSEDYELIMRYIANDKKVVNLSDILLLYRVHKDSVSWSRANEQRVCADYIQRFYRDSALEMTDFSLADLQRYLKKHNVLEKNNDYLLKARQLGSKRPFARLAYLFKAILTSSVQRNYLVNLLMARGLMLLSN